MSFSINDAPLTLRHFYITCVASLGQLIGTGLSTLVSVIIPLYQLVSHPELSSIMQGIVGAIDLIGIMVGSAIIGKLSDKHGYLLFFRLCPLFICGASLTALFFSSLWVLIVCLFIMGFAIGGEYSLDSNYISTLMPEKWRSFMVGSAKAASSLGNIGVAAICFLIVREWTDGANWPRLLWIMVFISGLMFILRIRFWESPKWLLTHGKVHQAEIAANHFLGPDVYIPTENQALNNVNPPSIPSTREFLSKNWKKVIFTGVPWACEGLGVYGIGIFLPILVMALDLEHISPSELPIQQISSSIFITFLISCIILPGFILGLFLTRKLDIVKIQIYGFLLSAASLLLLLLAYQNHWTKWIAITAFMGFELFLNIGPHLISYILPPKVYPVEVRGLGSGLSASIGKLGAVLGVFFIPILLHDGGSKLVLLASIIVMLFGGLITFIFNPERKVSVSNQAPSDTQIS